MSIIGRSPQFRNNPNAQSMIDVIQRNDAARGEQIARNICTSYGTDPQTALQQAREFFHL